MAKAIIPVTINHVTFAPGFWGDRVTRNREVTLPVQHEQCTKSGRLGAFELKWKPGDPNPPHQFWDSDVAKWVEASAYSLATHPDPALHAVVEQAVETIASAQQPDGYLNVHYTIVEPEKRWTDLKDGHEIYTIGHLIEAAVAWYEATGSRVLLDVGEKMSDHVASQFGHEKGKRPGYCGHPEAELAFMRLARATGQQRHAQLAKYMVDERGKSPYIFDTEAKAKGLTVTPGPTAHDTYVKYDYYQAHKPLRDQPTLGGHAVRALYLLAGAIDVATDTSDRALMKICKRLYNSVVDRQMYVTGGVGSRRLGETFTYDYDLPNETAYAETCAAISLVFVAHRLLQIEPNAEYADAMERALYNGVMSGVSLSGDRFRYANPLTVSTEALNPATDQVQQAARQEWFGCACCPPNIARLLASLGQYVYSTSNVKNASSLYVHLYASGRVTTNVNDVDVTLEQITGYPWDEKVELRVNPSTPTEFTLAVRLPGWCRQHKLKVNGKTMVLDRITKDGYACVKRQWKTGDRVELTFPMPVERITTNSSCRNNIGKIALGRGPIIYCLEQVDHKPLVHSICLPKAAKVTAVHKPKLLGGVTVLTAEARYRVAEPNAPLYTTGVAPMEKTVLTAVPYSVWGNRRVGNMAVWMGEC